ncbi:MAG: excinuclease ABC subunit UvrC [Bacteroidota bacterium]
MTNEDYKVLAPSLPKQPGVYRFLDKDGTILYVGKAKSLKNRLSSYFGSQKDKRGKVRTLVKNADHIEYTIVETEQDALLLENTLIKEYQPRYNVMLRDDKSYNYITIKNERFPRVYITRKVVKDGSQYFGPYTSKSRIKVILELIKTLFPLRTCSLNLTEENIQKGKFKVCLEYHIKNCKGPCEDLESEETYNEKIEQVRNILKGKQSLVKRHFKLKMQEHAENLAFEKAQDLKEKLTAFEGYQSKSQVVDMSVEDVDVFNLAVDEKFAYVNYLKVVEGAIINAHTQEVVQNLDDEAKDLLEYVIPNMREKFNSIAPEIIVPFEIELPNTDATITIPQRGDKRKLLELSEKNVQYFLQQKRRQEINKIKKQTSAERILRTMKEDLQMDVLPTHIECFDNSNLQGSHPVSSCVVFKNAKPSNKDYRHYNIKTVEGPNDFASMEEVVYRRYKRQLSEGRDLPQLIIIDGGKGQLSASMKSIKALGLEDKITVIGIAKRLEEIFFPDDPIPLYINKKSESLKVIQHARNEAHRFAITFHRNQRSRNFLGTTLTNIPGVGEKTAQKLLQSFGSVKKVKEADLESVAAVAGKSAAMKVKKWFEEEAG